MPLGATPVCPWMKSKKPTPFIWTGRLAFWKVGCGGKAGVELRPDGGHRRIERTGGAVAGGRRNLRDHRVSDRILQHDVVIDVVFQLVERHGPVHHVHRGFGGRDAGIERRAGRGGNHAQGGDGGADRITQVDQAGIGVGADLDGPALHAAGRALDRNGDGRGRRAALRVGDRGRDVADTGGEGGCRAERKDVVAGGLIAVRAIVEELLGGAAANAGQIAGDREAGAGRRGRGSHGDREQQVAGRIDRWRA